MVLIGDFARIMLPGHSRRGVLPHRLQSCELTSASAAGELNEFRRPVSLFTVVQNDSRGFQFRDTELSSWQGRGRDETTYSNMSKMMFSLISGKTKRFSHSQSIFAYQKTEEPNTTITFEHQVRLICFVVF